MSESANQDGANAKKGAGGLKAIALLVLAGIAWIVQHFTGISILDRKQQEGPAQDTPVAGAPEQPGAKPKPETKVKTPPDMGSKPKPEPESKPDPKPDPNSSQAPSAPPKSDGAAQIKKLFQDRQSDAWVECEGEVVHLLPDDNHGSRHQLFLLELSNDITLKISHNIDLAPYIPLKKGDTVRLLGEYEWNDKGGVVHWTHHNPNPNPIKPGGWIDHKGKRYE